MKSTDSFFNRLAIKRPFASGDGAELTAIGDSASNSVNYADGFPSVYEAAVSDNGKYVSRGEMNAIGNLASQSQFYFQAGGINEFDQAFANKIGGYPKNAVLDYLVGTRLYKVVSLQDDNLVDYTGSEPASGTSIAKGSVDNVNWAYCNMDVPDTEVVVGKMPSVIAWDTVTPLFTFNCPMNGNLFLNGTFKTNLAFLTTSQSAGAWRGCGLFIKETPTGGTFDLPESPSSLHDWNLFYQFSRLTSSTGTGVSSSAVNVTRGKRYTICSACGPAAQPRETGGLQEDRSIPLVYDVDMKVCIV